MRGIWRFVTALMVVFALGLHAASPVAAMDVARAEQMAMRKYNREVEAKRKAEAKERAWKVAALNDYLEGSPLAGYGEVFYDEAKERGLDPRLSPAISCIESGKGRHCFRSHNAWGWGRKSWPSWEAAIEGHVAGIVRGYGLTTPERMGSKYCPPNPAWPRKVRSQMEAIW